MNCRISVYGKGNEFTIGEIKKETWDYIQERFGGDEQEYLDALDNGDVPDEHQLASDSFCMYECDDLYHHDGCWSNYFRIEVDDEKGENIFTATNEELESNGVSVDTEYESIDSSIPYLCCWSSVAKGLYLTGEFEVEGEFDPKKLKVKYKRVCYDNDDSCDEVVDGLEYDGEEIEAEFDSSDGKGDTTTFVEVSR